MLAWRAAWLFAVAVFFSCESNDKGGIEDVDKGEMRKKLDNDFGIRRVSSNFLTDYLDERGLLYLPPSFALCDSLRYQGIFAMHVKENTSSVAYVVEYASDVNTDTKCVLVLVAKDYRIKNHFFVRCGFNDIGFPDYIEYYGAEGDLRSSYSVSDLTDNMWNRPLTFSGVSLPNNYNFVQTCDGREVVRCIADKYGNHGWLSVGWWIASAVWWQFPVGTAIGCAAACIWR